MLCDVLRGVVLVCLVSTGTGSIQNVVEVATESDPAVLRSRWLKTEETFVNAIQMILKQVLPRLLRANSDLDISVDCADSLTTMIFAIQQQKNWAYQMLDAMAKPNSGVLEGSVTNLGSFFQCLRIRVPENIQGVEKEEEFRGQYCHVDMRPALPPKPRFYRIDRPLEQLKDIPIKNPVISFIRNQSANFYLVGMRFGVCTPSTCQKDDVMKIATIMGNMVGFSVDVPHCEVDVVNQLDDKQIIVLSVLGGVALISFLCTAFHITAVRGMSIKNAGVCRKLLSSFSLIDNISRLVNTKSTGNSNLAALHGLKFLSIAWIILGHTYLYVNWQLFQELTVVFDYIKDFPFQTIMNASVAVDTFFFIGALLSAYISTEFVDKFGIERFNVPILIGRRIWRLLPSALVAASLMILVPLFGSGPLWHETLDKMVQCCRDNWWAILVFGNNFLYPGDMCLQHTWYIACDLQLYIVGLIFLLLIFKNRKFGILFGAVLVLINILISGFVTYWFEHPPTTLVANVDVEQRLEIFHYNYFLPHNHVGVYAIGLGTGYFLAKNRAIKLSWRQQLLGWTLGSSCCLTILYVVAVWDHHHPPLLWESVVYSAFRGVTWATGLTWLAVSCATGHGGLVNSFLSWKAFLPLSRLTYAIYLLHFMVIWTYVAAQTTTVETRHLFAVYIFFGYLCVTTLLAVLLRLLYEAPMQEVEKILLEKLFKKKLEVKPSTNENSFEKTNCNLEPKKEPKRISDSNGEHVMSRL